MKIRIRELRKTRGMTLQVLADLVGTTPQTVQRLETSNMTVSTDWLDKFAQAFGVEPADLLRPSKHREIPFLGGIGSDGVLHQPHAQDRPHFFLHVPADDPVAIRLDQAIGPFHSGMILVGDRLHGESLATAYGKDCLVSLETGMILLCRVVKSGDDGFILVSLRAGGEVRYDPSVCWIARIVMAVHYLQ